MSFNHAGYPLRPVWWGFFVALGGFLVLFAAQSFWRSHSESTWTQLKVTKERELKEFIQERLLARIDAQKSIAEQVLRIPEIQSALEGHTPSSLGAAFQRLEHLDVGEDVSIDVLDAKGISTVWSGRGLMPRFRTQNDSLRTTELVGVTLSSLHRYLSVGVKSSDAQRTVVVSRPLEMSYPVSNRFVSRQSLADDLLQESGIFVRFSLDVARRDTAGETAFAVPLIDNNKNFVCYALLPVPTVTTEIQRSDRFFETAKSIFGAATFVFVGLLLFALVRSDRWKRQQGLAAIVLLWGLRIAWKLIGFPGLFVGGFLFDPAIHASPFPLGLASSLGELVLSSAAVLVTFLIHFAETVRWWRSSSKGASPSAPWRVIGGYALAVLLPLLFQLVVRGYGAAMRSFVFDSSIRYQDPMSMMPNVPMVVMHVSVFMLTLALLVAWAIVFMVVYRKLWSVRKDASISPMHGLGVLVLSLVTYGLYLLADDTPQLPWYLPILIYGTGFGLMMAWDIRERKERTWARRPLVGAAVLFAATFLISLSALDAKIHEKERERVQVLAEELLRPVDTWLSLVVSESLRSCVASASEQLTGGLADSTASVDIAFGLWAQTLISKEGFNSAVVAYNDFGKEISRFSVGLTSYEQMELLSQVFHKEEETLLVVDRKVADGATKYYGEWGSVLDERGQHLGTIAVIISASQRTLFRGDAPEQLRSSSRDRFEDVANRTLVSDYRSGILWTTNDPLLFKGARLESLIERALQDSTARFVWTGQEVEGRATDVLYVRDDSDKTRVLALRIAPMDLRWHLFYLVKTMVVYLFFLALVAGVVVARRRAGGAALRFGFREKLLTSFAILSVLPLILMAYYNRELAIERLDQNITRRLSQDLDIVQQRFASTIVEDQDFSEGVNNDFCEAVASDLGVDFSVYAGPMLKASSRPELYRASILDSRLTGSAYVNSHMLAKGFYKTQERIGEVDYIVGYRPIMIGDSVRGVLAVPALYRQQEIDEELAQRNAFVLGAYAFVVAFVIGLGVVLAHALSKPLRELSNAALSVGKGDLDVVLKARTADEVGDLIRSFNVMTSELKASRARLVRAEREVAWKEMAKQVAHEIKNPLTPIKLSIQHLVEAYKQNTKDFGDILQRVSQTVVEQIEVLTRIASEFSNFARMPERHFERVDLAGLLMDSVNLFKEVKAVTFRTSLSVSPSFVIADKDELRRVFINILRNSVQAMEQGGVISVDLTVDHQVCVIRISDTGSGIPEELQEKVFQPNFSTKTDGTGLGLAIAQKVIEDLDGSILLQSKVGQGTTIEMNIPLRHS